METQISAGPGSRDGCNPVRQILDSPGASLNVRVSGLPPLTVDHRRSLGQAVPAKNILHITQFTATLKEAFHRIARAGVTLERSFGFPDCPSHTQPLSLSPGEFLV